MRCGQRQQVFIAGQCCQSALAESRPVKDSALDSLVAARHAVLADLAQNPPAPGGGGGGGGAGASGGGSADLARRESSQDCACGAPRREAALLDPLLQARRLVRRPSTNPTSPPTAGPAAAGPLPGAPPRLAGSCLRRPSIHPAGSPDREPRCCTPAAWCAAPPCRELRAPP